MLEAFVFTVSLTFTIHEQPQFVNMDLNTHITFESTIHQCGTSWLPHISTINPTCPTRSRTGIIRHEQLHQEHWAALGPAYPLAYVLTGGRAFEYYRDMEWVPPEGLKDSCPLVRVSDEVEFMPCYRL